MYALQFPSAYGISVNRPSALLVQIYCGADQIESVFNTHVRTWAHRSLPSQFKFIKMRNTYRQTEIAKLMLVVIVQ